MVAKQKFMPRSLCDCRKALGSDAPPCPAFDDGLIEGVPEQEVGDDPRLFHLLQKPRRGDWLESKNEPGQSYPQYFKRMHPRTGNPLPRPVCSGLLVCPVGTSFSKELRDRFLPHLLEYYTAFFPGMPVEVLAKPLSLKDVQSRENDFGHPQYLIGDIFKLLNTHKDVISKRSAYSRLAITFEDIYPGEEWNYVFGQARPLERVGVFSFARHSPLFYEGVHALEALPRLDMASFLDWMRTCRHTMVHETCHMLGILHCVYWHCLMNGSNGPHDSNGHTNFLCPVCLKKLLLAVSGVTQVNHELVLARYRGLQTALEALAADLKSGGASDESFRSLFEDTRWLQLRQGQLQAQSGGQEGLVDLGLDVEKPGRAPVPTRVPEVPRRATTPSRAIRVSGRSASQGAPAPGQRRQAAR